MRVLNTALLTVATLTAVAAQSPPGVATAEAFEVVSIKPSNPDAPGPTMPPVGGRYTASNVSLRQLVQIVYDIGDSRIDGGPDWQTSRRFDIQAKAADPIVGIEAMRPLLKAMLADRFQLKVHTETREMPIYTLVTRDDGTLGAGVTRSTVDCSRADQAFADARARDPQSLLKQLAGDGVPCAIMPAPARVAGSMTMRARGASMANLASFLTAAAGRMVVDRTGLSGLYDWELTFDRAIRPQATLPGDTPVSTSPSLMTALQEQIGLKLESGRGPVDILVIDSAALPRAD
jgi:uncharacterized protein (TIGR03435 family)